MVKKTSKEKYNLQILHDPEVLEIYKEKLHFSMKIDNFIQRIYEKHKLQTIYGVK